MLTGRPWLRRVRACLWGGVWMGVFGTGIECPANPTGGVVTLGDAQIQNVVPGLTTIVQSTDRAVIDWQSFSIAAGEQTNFIVPNSTSATLNRVLGCAPSLLNGSLTSNGHVFLINSNGIIFGKGSTVDVAGLTASSLDLDNCKFMAGGEMVFKGSSEAAVRNAGMIRASSGDAFLIGYQVSNSGTISAPNGTVGLAAGSEVLIMPVGDERVVVRNAVGSRKKTGVSNSGVIEANVAELKAHNGNVYALAIRNTGRVAATAVTRQGGRILLSANGGSIDNSGQLVARGSSGNGGRIKVSAGNGGKATINGRVDADGPDGAGGKVIITGEEVTIRRAVLVSADGKTEGGQINIGTYPEVGNAGVTAARTEIAGDLSVGSLEGKGGEIRLAGHSLALEGESVIRADGATGGGRIFVGGGLVGDASFMSSSCVTIDCGVLLTANALENGNGGQVVMFADKALTFQGRAQALGGASSGDGGLVVLTAKESLRIDQLTDRVELSAANGRAGGLHLKSSEFEILDPGCWVSSPLPANRLNAADLSTFLNTAQLTLETERGSSGGSGNIYLKGTVAWNSAQGLTLSADCDFLMINDAIGRGVIDAQGGGAVTINVTRAVLLETGTEIRTTTGDVQVRANQREISIPGHSQPITVNGSIVTAGGDITLVGRVSAESGAGTPAILLDGDGTLRADGGGVITLKTAGGVVVSHGSLIAAGLILEGNGDFTLTGVTNAIGTVATAGTVGSILLENSTALSIGSLGAASGLNAVGDISVSTTSADGLLVRQSILSQGGAISLNASVIKVDGTTVTSTGGAPVTLTAHQFVLSNQPIINGVLQGSGGTAALTLDDSGLTAGQSYVIGADRITAGGRTYAFQNVSAIRLDLGAGNDLSDTNFFTFDQFLNAGGGTNQLFVGGGPVTSSPLTRPGFGTITFSGFVLTPPPPPAPPPTVAAANIPTAVPAFGAFLLQNAVPVGNAGSNSATQANNFASSASPGAGLAGAGGGALGMAASAAVAGLQGGGVLASLTGSIGQSLGLVSAGGGAPPSIELQSQMNATSSSAVQSELSLALGGDGTMGVRSSTGLVAVNPGGGAPSTNALGQLATGTSLLAQSELALGAIGFGEVALISQFGAQSINLGGPPPVASLQRSMAQTAGPESYATLSVALGGDGTARIDSSSGDVAIDLKEQPVPASTQASLQAVITPGSFGELSLALGGTGEFVLSDFHGMAVMDASGSSAGPQVSARVLAMLAASSGSQMSLVLGGEGTALVLAQEGIQNIFFEAVLPSAGVISQLTAATNAQSVEELDNATR
jgi:filamentous hemagglutinin family protein